MNQQFIVEIPKHRLSFSVGSKETILNAAKRQHIPLPFGCESGGCGNCKAKVINGNFVYNKNGDRSDEILTAYELKENFSLLCCAIPQEDIVIEVDELADWQILKLPTKINKIEYLTDEVVFLQLRLPPLQNLNYRPGQYVEILLPQNQKRIFSIANPASDIAAVKGGRNGINYRGDNRFLDFHIRKRPNGVFSNYLNQLTVGKLCRIEGPYGQFAFHQDKPQRPIVFIAGGTGFAPIHSLIEQMILIDSKDGENYKNHKVFFYWGVQDVQQLYLTDPLKRWQSYFSNINLSIVENKPTNNNKKIDIQVNLRRGLVHEVVMQDFPDLSAYDVYTCGAPAMIDAAQRDFVNICNLPPDRFFADSFIWGGDSKI